MIFRFSEGFFNFKTVILSKLNFVRQTICQIIGICSLVKQAIFFVKGVLEQSKRANNKIISIIINLPMIMFIYHNLHTASSFFNQIAC